MPIEQRQVRSIKVVCQRTFRLTGVVTAFFAGDLTFDSEALALLPTSAYGFKLRYALHQRLIRTFLAGARLAAVFFAGVALAGDFLAAVVFLMGLAAGLAGWEQFVN